MGTITRGAKAGGGTNLNAGQVADPAEVNDDFNTAYTEINGLLDDANVETATIPGAKSFRFTEISDPSTPSSNDILLYAKDVGGTTVLYTKDSAGVATAVGLAARSYLAGLGTVQAADADHDITVAVGVARDSTNATDIVLTAAITKQLDAAWTVGTNVGGLDTGSIAAATWYHLWLIKRSDTGVVDVLFSTSATAPTMPTSYDYKRRIAAVQTAAGGTTIIDYVQTGDLFLWLVPFLDFDDATEAATLRTLSVPPGITVVAILNAEADWTAGGQAALFTCPDQTDSVPTLSGLAQLSNDSANHLVTGQIHIRTDTSKRIRSRTTGTLDAIRGATDGWYDRRGRDD